MQIEAMLAPRDNHLDKAWSLVFQLLNGRLTLDDLAEQVADASRPALQARVDGLLRQLTFHKEQDNEARLRALFVDLAHDGGRRVELDRFAALLGTELAGVVLTAHPTFSMSADAYAAALELMRDGAASARPQAANGGAARGVAVRRHTPPSLQDEVELSTAALRHLRKAIRRLLRVAVVVAAELYPNDYRTLRPRLVTVATWVGFDLDGRTDIGWSKSLSCRYQLALAGLTELAASLAELREAHSDYSPPVADAFATIESGLAALRDCFAIGLDSLGREAEDSTRLGKLNRLALEKRPLKQDAIGAIDGALAVLVDDAQADALAQDAIVFRAEWETLGLGLARLHFRLNSVQLHNAIRPDIALSAQPGQSQSRRHFLAEGTRLLDSVEPVNVHYGTVAREQTTAKRVFMLVAQFKKHFDSRTPVRLLIAESDTPFTLLAALYYARLFGVESYVEISPLFETADGLHHGDRVIAEVLDNPHFVSYIRRQRRFCVQLGFSDSGRYIGQPAASLAIERFKLRLVRLWQARGFGDVQLLFFDTHGESIGRGAHPRSLADRFLYTHSREVRQRLAELPAPYKHEVSFQGGEGYLWFASERTAFAVLTDLVSARLGRDSEPKRDALYTHSGWALDFFLTLKDYQERLTRHRGYLALVNTLGRNFLYPTGSRAMQRQSGGRTAPSMESIAEMRAIPNNAILHQLGYLANSFAGLGRAADQSPETFLAVLDDSDRLERILSLALAARERSDVTMLEAYVQLLSANYWLDRTTQSLDRHWNRTLRRVSRVLEDTFQYDAIAGLVRRLRRDAAELEDALERRNVSGPWSSADALARLHTLRLALIQLIYVKAMEIPQFSSRLEVSLGTLVERLLHLDVPDTVDTLRRIFPAAPPSDDTDIYAERDTYVRASPSGYAAEHAQIFDPIERAYGLILEVSALIALHVGAYG
ncbi:MAG TPA: phosphoenolpyruvate carboxylase [Gammaproteobacteria bacterium]|nr:phosphoenolpyruvate carboxylase [Gammaproteobacteria bacterium]